MLRAGRCRIGTASTGHMAALSSSRPARNFAFGENTQRTDVRKKESDGEFTRTVQSALSMFPPPVTEAALVKRPHPRSSPSSNPTSLPWPVVSPLASLVPAHSPTSPTPLPAAPPPQGCTAPSRERHTYLLTYLPFVCSVCTRFFSAACGCVPVCLRCPVCAKSSELARRKK